MAKTDIIKIALLGYSGCSAWISAGILEFFAIANVVTSSRQVSIRFDCHTITGSGRTVQASQGVRLQSQRPSGRYAAVIVPPFAAASRRDFETRIEGVARRLLPTLRSVTPRAHIVASACSGAVMLAEAGLLSGRRATTCWWLADWFGKRYPDVMMQAEKLVVTDGNRWTAAAGTAYLHLCLELVKKLADEEIAAAAARLALVEPKRGSQSPFLAGVTPSQLQSESVREAVQLIEGRLATATSIAVLAQQLGTTERTLNRRFRNAFDMSPIAYLQSRRIALAKRLLESERLSLERIVERCGYTDAASFRKLFAREVGMTPREYRSRFGSGEAPR